jgi:hypothetical protein
VSRPGWSANNALAIIITGTGERSAWSFDGSPKLAPLLYVEYTTGGSTGAVAGAEGAPATSIVSSSILNGEVTAADVAQAQRTESDEAELMDEGSATEEESPEAVQEDELYLPILSE